MLFEEAVLFLLRRAGYRTVDGVGGDPTLQFHPAGLAVVGRGAVHQIDAIADYLVGQPFSHPQRLLVEAKCFTNDKPVDLEVTRNAVGVLKDVSEYWSTANGVPREHRRYHYQKAIFSATTFTAPAERYAFAHDINLFPLADSECFAGVRDAIFGINRHTFRQPLWNGEPLTLAQLRGEIRQFLSLPRANAGGLFGGDLGPEWSTYGEAVRALGGVVVGLVGRTFPLFLVPSARGIIDQLPGVVEVRVRRGKGSSWTLQSYRNEVLFSFELPPVLFTMYAEAGVLTREAAAQMKIDLFTEMQAVVFEQGALRLIQFQPEEGWLRRLVDFARDAAVQRAQRG